MSELSVAIIQTQSVDDFKVNQQTILKKLESVARKKVDLVCLPENALYMRVIEGEAITGLGIDDPIFAPFKEWAEKNKTAIHFGSVPIKSGKKLGNSSVVIYPDGRAECDYTKIHLFDIQLENQAAIRESDVFAHGEAPKTFMVKDWKIGQTICYDLRFSELFHQYAKLNVDVILVPAAFLVPTGRAHWEVLLRARAIESQCYVLAAAQAGVHNSVRAEKSRSTFGHSMAIGPWGEVLAKGDSLLPKVLYCKLVKSEIEKVRRQIPMRSHRRL
jgi:predicted amidohydrolase